VQLIIIDECSMLHEHHFACLDRSLRHLCQSQVAFAGKIIVLAGDFAQTQPSLQRLIDAVYPNMTVGRPAAYYAERAILGMYLTEPLFGHGTLYVGLSRTCDPSNVHLCITRRRTAHCINRPNNLRLRPLRRYRHGAVTAQ
jgi:hypothetical protein